MRDIVPAPEWSTYRYFPYAALPQGFDPVWIVATTDGGLSEPSISAASSAIISVLPGRYAASSYQDDTKSYYCQGSTRTIPPAVHRLAARRHRDGVRRRGERGDVA